MAMAQAVLVGGKGLVNLHPSGAISTSKSQTQPLRRSVVTALPTPLPVCRNNLNPCEFSWVLNFGEVEWMLSSLCTYETRN